jgi:ubiquinone/menaquinone biosynthesis C-methylase UbiE
MAVSLSRALSIYFEQVDGVDVSRTMIAQATAYNKDFANGAFYLSERPDLKLLEDETFDLVYSNIVLQHMSPKLAGKYLTEFARCTRPGGIIAFQMPHARRWNRSSLIRYARDCVFTLMPAPLVRLYRRRYRGGRRCGGCAS